MATLSELRTLIADDIDRSDLSSQIDDAINVAIDQYADKYFWFKQGTGTFVTVASQKSYGTGDGLPSDIGEVDYVEININNTDYRLEPRTYAYVQEVDPSTYIGDPDDYAWYENKIYLYPVPDASYTVTVSYVKTYSELATDGASNDFTTSAKYLIRSKAKTFLYRNTIHDIEKEATAERNVAEALKVLESRTEKLTTGRTKPTYF